MVRAKCEVEDIALQKPVCHIRKGMVRYDFVFLLSAAIFVNAKAPLFHLFLSPLSCREEVKTNCAAKTIVNNKV